MPKTPSKLPSRGLYAITDMQLEKSTLLKKTALLLEGGIAILQYRNKNKHDPDYLSTAKALQSLCQQYNRPFIINDDLELAEAIEADGIHIGKDDVDLRQARARLGEKRIIGLSCYNLLERVRYAEANNADYIALGAFYPSPSKPNAPRAGLQTIRQGRRISTRPIVAIGGILPENGGTIISAGAQFLAAISGLYRGQDILDTLRNYQALFDPCHA